MDVIVSESGKGKLTQQITIGNHVLIADEPLDKGGSDLGPSPYDFLLTALGTCTSMTLRMYADFKKIPLQHITVKLQYDRIYSEDCKECDNPKSRIDHINRQIELEGDLSDADRSKLLEIANKCPVHRTLTSKISITTELVK